MIARGPSLLEQLEHSGCKVDVDSYDPEVARSLPFTPHDATTNQALIGLVVYPPENRHIVEDVVKSNPGASPHDILTILVSRFEEIRKSPLMRRCSMRSLPRSSLRISLEGFWLRLRQLTRTTWRR